MKVSLIDTIKYGQMEYQQLNILYSFRRCPYAIRARMALNYADIQYQYREILLKNKPQSMLSYSAKATVPVLITKDGIIDESIDVMHWSLSQFDPDKWLLQPQQNNLIELCDKQFKPQLDRYKYSDRHELTEDEYRDEVLWFLDLLDKRLQRHSQLFSDNVSMADISIFPFIRQFAFVDKQWFDDSTYTYLQKWLTGHLQSDLFIKVMEKHPLWSDK
ncbi:MAG: glutathione S-transferase [Xanthomonadales bacterium]|nr:glutathione S-transferase [Xanthomonadales bacterium]